MSKTRDVVSHAGRYSLAAMLTQLVNVLSALLMRFFLGPMQVGVWSLVQLILTYANYSNLGTMDAIALEIPYRKGKGENNKAESIKNTAFTFAILTSFPVSLSVFVYAFFFRRTLSQQLSWALLFTSALVLLQRINALLVMLLRAYKHFDLAGRVTLYSAMMNAALIAFFAFRYKLYGFMLAMVLSFLFNILYIFSQQRFHFRYELKRKELSALIAYGLPLMALSLFTTFFETIDKIMITRFLGFEALGLYSIGLMTFAYINSIPNAVSIVLIPNLQERFGQSQDKNDLKGYLSKSDEVFTVLMPILVGAAWFLVPPVVQHLLPKFAAGIGAMRYLVLSCYFVGVGLAPTLFIYTVRKHFIFFPLIACSCLWAILFNWLAISRGMGIRGVGAATTLAMFCHFTALYAYASLQVFSLREFFARYSGTLLKFLGMAMLLLMVESHVKIESLFLEAALKTTLFFLVYAPFLWVIHRKYGLLPRR